jgi:hypothetical protein
LKIIDFSSSTAAFYAISVRQASALPAASFRSHLAMGTLAVRLIIPPVGLIENLHLQVSAPCRAHDKKSPAFAGLSHSQQWRNGLHHATHAAHIGHAWAIFLRRFGNHRHGCQEQSGDG